MFVDYVRRKTLVLRLGMQLFFVGICSTGSARNLTRTDSSAGRLGPGSAAVGERQEQTRHERSEHVGDFEGPALLHPAEFPDSGERWQGGAADHEAEVCGGGPGHTRSTGLSMGGGSFGDQPGRG